MAKKEEQVLVIQNKPSIHFASGDYFHFADTSLDSWIDEIMPEATFVDRWMAESDSTILQLIPYIMIFSPDKKVFSYQRKGSEQRLVGKFSVGIGGHINPQDQRRGLGYKKNTNGIGWDTVQQGAVREICEELVLDPNTVRPRLIPCGVLYTPQDDSGSESKPGPSVGQVHLGIVYALPLTTHELQVREEDAILSYKFIYKPSDITKFEKWSQLTLQKAEEIREKVFRTN